MALSPSSYASCHSGEARKEMLMALAKHGAAHPDVLATSARSGAGIPELRSAIVRLLEERGAD